MEQEDLIERDVTLSVLLPGGHERTLTVHGSKPVMDVFVILCARYHLNPSDHMIELFSTNRNQLKFKPSSLIGSLEAELVLLKHKQSDKKKTQNMPVATVRLLINYGTSHKTVVRVRPSVPLVGLMPAVCEKCEMDPKTTVLLKNGQSEEPLDLTKTLNEYGIRELYAKGVPSCPVDPGTLSHKGSKKDKMAMQESVLGETENRGILSLFRKSKKSVKETVPNTNIITAATSVVLKNPHVNNMCSSEANSTSCIVSSEMPKKRRAPQPPSVPGSQSDACELNTSQRGTLPYIENEKQGVLSRASSTDSSLKRNKRRAPPPPCPSPSLPDISDKENSYTASLPEDAEEDNLTAAGFDQSCDFEPTLSCVMSSTLMLEVLSECNDRMKTMEQEDASNERSVARSPPPQMSGTGDGDPVVPPGCEQLWHGSQRDGLTTFTVVPRRRPRSTRQYEFLLTLEPVNGGTLEGTEMEKVRLEKADDESEKVEKPDEERNLIVDAESTDRTDWIAEYEERRRRFLGKDDVGKGVKLKTSRKGFDEDMVDDIQPLSQLSVCWEDEEDTQTRNQEEAESFGEHEVERFMEVMEEQQLNPVTIQNPSRYNEHDPTSDATYTHWDVNISSTLPSSNRDIPSQISSESSLHSHQPISVQHSFKLSSPNSASPFALAVTRRVQSLGSDVCPLIWSARRISPPTPRPQSNLISEEFLRQRS